MSRTDSISHSSSPLQYCISAITPRYRCRCSRRSPTSCGPACRTPWCNGAMVVRSQCGRLLSHRRLPRHHVLLHPEAGRAADLFLSALDHPLLGADLSLHLGGTASPTLHGIAGLGADARHDVFDHAVDAILGRHDQWNHDAVRRVGQAAHRSCVAHDGGFGRILRHGDLRGAADVSESRELALSLHRMDHRPCSLRRAGMGRVHFVRRDLLPGAVAVEPSALLAQAGQLALLDLDHRHSTSRRCGWRASCRG
jgi:hypothetical protein